MNGEPSVLGCLLGEWGTLCSEEATSSTLFSPLATSWPSNPAQPGGHARELAVFALASSHRICLPTGCLCPAPPTGDPHASPPDPHPPLLTWGLSTWGPGGAPGGLEKLPPGLGVSRSSTQPCPLGTPLCTLRAPRPPPHSLSGFPDPVGWSRQGPRPASPLVPYSSLSFPISTEAYAALLLPTGLVV